MISTGVFENIELLYPPLELQIELQNKFSDIFEQINKSR